MPAFFFFNSQFNSINFMKAFKRFLAISFIGAILLIVASSQQAQAQVIGKITKVTAASSVTGTITVEDTTGTGNYVTFNRADVFGVLSGTTTADARLTIRSKNDPDTVLATFLLATARVVYATTQSISNKIIWLKANAY